MADTQGAAGDRVDRGAVGAAVVGQHLLHGEAVACVERDSTPEEGDDGASFLVGEDLGVGQAGAVIDRDVDVSPSRRAGAIRPERPFGAAGFRGWPCR
jgi:hypothetical protein